MRPPLLHLFLVAGGIFAAKMQTTMARKKKGERGGDGMATMEKLREWLLEEKEKEEKRKGGGGEMEVDDGDDVCRLGRHGGRKSE